MQRTKEFVDFLFRFKCPKCDVSSFEAKVMQDHLLWCKKEELYQENLLDLVEDEIRQEINNETLLSESNGYDQNSYTKFEDSKSKIHDDNVSDTEPDSVPVKQEPLEPKSSTLETSENLDDENENNIETNQGPKIGTVFSPEQALALKENKANESTKRANVCEPDLNGNQKKTKRSKPIVCNWKNCRKRFRCKSEQIKHYRTHTGEQPFACDWKDCLKKFSSLSDCVRHYRIHSGEKPFACEWKNCGKKFTQVSHLIIHNRTHTGEKPFVCDWTNCGKKFRRCDDRTIHYRIHTGEKPYFCGWKNCTQRFATRSRLNRHSETHIS